MSFTVNRVPFGGGAVPSIRAPMSSKSSPTGIFAGVSQVAQMSVATAPGRGYFLFVAGPSMITFATLFKSCPVTTLRTGGWFGFSFATAISKYQQVLRSASVRPVWISVELYAGRLDRLPRILHVSAYEFGELRSAFDVRQIEPVSLQPLLAEFLATDKFSHLDIEL